MSENGIVIIIPDENQILTHEYRKQIYENHLEAFIAFADKFKLGYHFTLDDYQYAPEKLALDGHLIVKETNGPRMVVMYIPEIVTDRQLEWFELHKFDYFNYQLIGAFSVANGSESKQISGLEEIHKEMIRKHFLDNSQDLKNVI